MTKCRDVSPVVSVSVMVVSVLELGGGVAPSWKGVCGAELKKKKKKGSHQKELEPLDFNFLLSSHKYLCIFPMYLTSSENEEKCFACG